MQVNCNTTFKKSDSTSNLYHLFLDAHQTHHLTKWLDFKVHHFHSGFPLPPRPLPDLSHLLKNYPKGQLSSVVKDVFCKGESNLYNDQFNIAKTEKWSKMSSKWWLHWKRRQEIIGIPELARFFQQVFFFLLFTLLGMPFQQFFSTTLFGWLFEIFFATILFQKLCCVKWIEKLSTRLWKPTVEPVSLSSSFWTFRKNSGPKKT